MKSKLLAAILGLAIALCGSRLSAGELRSFITIETRPVDATVAISYFDGSKDALLERRETVERLLTFNVPNSQRGAIKSIWITVTAEGFLEEKRMVNLSRTREHHVFELREFVEMASARDGLNLLAEYGLKLSDAEFLSEQRRLAKIPASARTTEISRMRKEFIIEAAAKHDEWPLEIRTAVVTGRLLAGMSGDAIRLAWGQPQMINKTTDGQWLSEQWVWNKGLERYAYLKNGTLTTWQETTKSDSTR
jgi:hypothetical protein